MADDDRTTLNEMLDGLERSQRFGARVGHNIRESMGLPPDTTGQQMQVLQALGSLAQIDAAVETAKLQAGADVTAAYGNQMLSALEIAQKFYNTQSVAATGMNTAKMGALESALNTQSEDIKDYLIKRQTLVNTKGGTGTKSAGKAVISVWTNRAAEIGPTEIQNLQADLAASQDNFNDVISMVESIDTALGSPGALMIKLQGNTDSESVNLLSTINKAVTARTRARREAEATLDEQGLSLENHRDESVRIIREAPRGVGTGADAIDMVLAKLMPSRDEFDTSTADTGTVEGEGKLDDDDDLDFLQNKYKALLARLENDMDDPSVAEQRDAIMATPKFIELVTDLGLNPNNAQHRKMTLNRYVRGRRVADKEKLKAFRDSEQNNWAIRLSAAGADKATVDEAVRLPPMESIISSYGNAPGTRLQLHVPETDKTARYLRLVDSEGDPVGDDYTFKGNATEALDTIIRDASKSGRLLLEAFNLAPSTSEVIVPTPATPDVTEDQRTSDQNAIKSRVLTGVKVPAKGSNEAKDPFDAYQGQVSNQQ